MPGKVPHLPLALDTYTLLKQSRGEEEGRYKYYMKPFHIVEKVSARQTGNFLLSQISITFIPYANSPPNTQKMFSVQNLDFFIKQLSSMFHFPWNPVTGKNYHLAITVQNYNSIKS